MYGDFISTSSGMNRYMINDQSAARMQMTILFVSVSVLQQFLFRLRFEIANTSVVDKSR
jgi:hypothetical protein